MSMPPSTDPPRNMPPGAGEASEVACSSCSALNPPNKKFCGECGKPLVAARSAPVPDDGAIEQSSAVPERDRVSVRQWFRKVQRSVSDTVGTHWVEELEHVRALAAAMRAVRDERLLSDAAFKALHAKLRLKGPAENALDANLRYHAPADTLWTVGLGSLRWNKFKDGKWQPAEAPDYVELDSQQLLAIADRGVSG